MKTRTIISTIRLADIFPENIISRSSISMLFNNKMQDSKIELDFSKIFFLSRSAAQQLELEKVELRKRNVEISCINANETIKKMLELVRNQSKSRINSEVTFKTFKSESERTEFLMSI
jgi:anti-anti-sigma regulatory factor